MEIEPNKNRMAGNWLSKGTDGTSDGCANTADQGKALKRNLKTLKLDFKGGSWVNAL